MSQLWQELLVLKELHNHSVSKTKTSTGLMVTTKGFQQVVIPAASSNGSQLALPVSCLKDNACGMNHQSEHSNQLVLRSSTMTLSPEPKPAQG